MLHFPRTNNKLKQPNKLGIVVKASEMKMNYDLLSNNEGFKPGMKNFLANNSTSSPVFNLSSVSIRPTVFSLRPLRYQFPKSIPITTFHQVII